MKILVVVDMQKDFVDGSLGTKEALEIVPKVVKKINNYDGIVIATRDTHPDYYLDTSEGKKLPVVHCIENTAGWEIYPEVMNSLKNNNLFSGVIDKPTFGSLELVDFVSTMIQEYGEENIEEIELIGLCTDICVISNALLLKTNFYEIPISIDSTCCAGVTPVSHEEALRTASMCQINIK
jgi:nicotinamidase-related amidase